MDKPSSLHTRTTIRWARDASSHVTGHTGGRPSVEVEELAASWAPGEGRNVAVRTMALTCHIPMVQGKKANV